MSSQSQRKPASGHVLTDDDRRKGAERANAVRRERGKSVRQRLAEIAQEKAEQIASVYLDAMDAVVHVYSKEGDLLETRVDHLARIRAATAFLSEAYGRPPVAITGKDGGPIQFASAEVDAARDNLAARIVDLSERRRARQAAGGAQ